MHVKYHFIASLIVATVSLPFNQNTPFLEIKLFGYEIAVFFLCMIAGVLVDIDHILDICINRKHFFESTEAKYRNGRWFVVFHGIETVVVLCALSIAFPFLIFPTASYICHIVMDFYRNGVSFPAYFYAVRFGKMFILRSKRLHNV
jgi:hypothetical protein